MKHLQYLIPVIILFSFGCNKHNDEPTKTENVFEADIDGKHWQADSAGAIFIPGNLTYGTNFFELKGRTSSGQSFYLTTKSDAPSEAIFEVAYTSFRAKFDLPDNNGITLNWSTIHEINAASFNIERSENGINFIKTGEVQALGNDSIQPNYEWHEKPPYSDRHYYRLKAINTSGLAYYSTVVAVGGGLHEIYFSSSSDTAYHFGFNGTVTLATNDTTTKHITGTFQFDFVDDGTGVKHTVRNGKFTNLAY